MKLNNLQQGQIYLGNKRISEIYIGDTKVFPYNEDIIFLNWVKFTDVTVSDAIFNDSYTPQGSEVIPDGIFLRADIRPKTMNIHVVMNVDLHSPEVFSSTFFGTRYKYNNGEYRTGLGGSQGGNTTIIDFNAFSASGFRYNQPNPYYTEHGFHLLETKGASMYIDGSLKATCTGTGYYNNIIRPWCPFGGCRTIKETLMWINNELIYHYVPVKKGNKYGLYDLLSGHFFGKETYIGGYDNNIVW